MRFAHVKSMCDYFSESSHYVGFKSSLAHSLYMSQNCFFSAVLYPQAVS